MGTIKPILGLHPLIAAAVLSFILLCLSGAAVITGMLPGFHDPSADAIAECMADQPSSLANDDTDIDNGPARPALVVRHHNSTARNETGSGHVPRPRMALATYSVGPGRGTAVGLLAN